MKKFPYIPLLLVCIYLSPSCSPRARHIPPTESGKTQFEPIPLIDFTLTERSGEKLGKKDLLGNVWVASFVFTRCTGPCPQVTATMAQLQQELKEVPHLRLVTFTVDPERDKPDELKKYAEHFRADPKKWLFLTGEEKKIHELLMKGFKIGVGRAENPEPGKEFDHSTRLVIVDALGNIRGFANGIRDENDPDSERHFKENLDNLKLQILELVKEIQ